MYTINSLTLTHISTGTTNYPVVHWDRACKTMSSLDSHDSAIEAQLYGLRSLSISNPQPSTHDLSSLTPVCYTASDFLDLLEAVDVPTLQVDWSDSTLIGMGGHSKVVYGEVPGRGETIGTVVALKRLSSKQQPPPKSSNLDSVSLSITTQAFLEVCLMRHPFLSTHPNVLELIAVVDSSMKHHHQLSGSSEICLVTEYADEGSLEALLEERGKELSWETKFRLLRDVAAGIHALHSCDIVHNDVKCGNVLIFNSGSSRRFVAKISDFGSAVPLATSCLMRRAPGTRLFASPEAYSDDCLVHRSRDVYSFGLLVLHTIRSRAPFDGYSEEEVWECKSDETLSRLYVDSCLSSSDLVRRIPSSILYSLLAVDQKKRISNILTVIDPPGSYQECASNRKLSNCRVPSLVNEADHEWLRNILRQHQQYPWRRTNNLLMKV